jgi:hypothetical protein
VAVECSLLAAALIFGQGPGIIAAQRTATATGLIIPILVVTALIIPRRRTIGPVSATVASAIVATTSPVGLLDGSPRATTTTVADCPPDCSGRDDAALDEYWTMQDGARENDPN